MAAVVVVVEERIGQDFGYMYQMVVVVVVEQRIDRMRVDQLVAAVVVVVVLVEGRQYHRVQTSLSVAFVVVVA